MSSREDLADQTSTAMREFYGAITTNGYGSDTAEAAALNLHTTWTAATAAGVTNDQILEAHHRTA